MARNGTQVLIVVATALMLLVLRTSSASGSFPTTFNSTVGLKVSSYILNSTSDNINPSYFKVTGNAVASPSGLFKLVLILESFGNEMPFYCWAEVQNSLTETTFMWREPCHPPVADNCVLNFTSDGNLVIDAGKSSTDLTTAFQTNTSGEGAVAVKLTDEGDLQLVKADNTTVWQSSDHLEADLTCRDPFNSSHRQRIGWFGLLFSIPLCVGMVLSVC